MRAKTLAFLALLLLPSAAARADERTETAARLFREAKELVKAGKAAEACPKFEESHKLDPGAGTQFNLADCYEKTGKLASAWKLFVDLEGVLRRVDDTERADKARERARAIEGSVPRLTIVAPWAKTTRGAAISRDGSLVDPAEIGAPIPLDPGRHEIVAQATNKKPITRTVVAAAGHSETLPLPELENDEASVAVVATPPTGRRTAGLVVGAVGIAALGTGVVLGVVAKSNYDDAVTGCPETGGVRHCPTGSGGAGRADSARSLATVGTIVGGVGLAAIVAGTILYVTSPSSGSAEVKSARRFDFTVGAGPSVDFGGRF